MATQIIRSGNFIRPDEVLREVGIREGMNVVHFGCGAGFYVVPAAKFVGGNGRVVGVDIRESSLETVRHKAKSENLDNLDVIRGDLAKLSGSHLPDGWADLVIVANILHQSDPQKVLAEAARVLRPEVGRLVAVEWEMVNVPFGPPVEHRVSPDMVLAAAKMNNLMVLRRWKPSLYHYALLFARAYSEA